jgi:hypothetical protein
MEGLHLHQSGVRRIDDWTAAFCMKMKTLLQLRILSCNYK